MVNDFECYKEDVRMNLGDTPVAKYIADRVLTLPLYAGITEEEVNNICDIILS